MRLNAILSQMQTGDLERALALVEGHVPHSSTESQLAHRNAVYRLRLLLQSEHVRSGAKVVLSETDISRAEEATVAAHDAYCVKWGRSTSISCKRVLAAVLTRHGLSRAEVAERAQLDESQVAWAIASAPPEVLRLALAIMEGTSLRDGETHVAGGCSLAYNSSEFPVTHYPKARNTNAHK